MGTHKKLMSTHNICFHAEKRKISECLSYLELNDTQVKTDKKDM